MNIEYNEINKGYHIMHKNLRFIFLVSILLGNMVFYCHGENTIDSTVPSEITTNMQFVATLNTNQLIGMESAVLTITLNPSFFLNDVSFKHVTRVRELHS